MDLDEAVHWLLRGKLRQQLLLSLNQPHTNEQLSRKLGVPPNLCTRGLRHLALYQLAACMTPQRRAHRLYWLTDLGADCQRELLRHHKLSPLNHVLPELEYGIYSAVCSRYRRNLVKCLTHPMRPPDLRRRALRHDRSLRMSSTNTRDTLRSLHRLGVVEKEFSFDHRYPRYRLSPLGKRLQQLLWNAEEAPCAGLLKI